MNKIIDGVMICIYCGDVMEALTKEQIKIFGKLICCDFDMLKIDGNKIHSIVNSMNALKSNLEKEILKGIM